MGEEPEADSEEAPSPEEVLEGSSGLGLAAKHDAVLYQMRGLFVGYAGLEYLNRVIQQTYLDSKGLVDKYHESSEVLFDSLGRYNSAIQALDPKNIKRIRSMLRPGRELRRIVLDMLRILAAEKIHKLTPLSRNWKKSLEANSREEDKIDDQTEEEYGKIQNILYDKYMMDPDPIVVAAWFGFNMSLAMAYKAAYESYKMLMDDVCRAFGYDYFRITKSEFGKHLEDLNKENIRGDQNTSIDDKAMLQLVVYAAWNHKELEDPLEIPTETGEKITVTLKDVFELAGLVDCFGWLKGSHMFRFEELWRRHHYYFGEIKRAVIGPLSAKFNTYIETIQQVKPFQATLKPMGEYNCAFQIATDYSWMSGMLPSKLRMEPYSFELKPSNKSSNVNFISGLHGGGKTTLLSAMAALSVLKYKQVVLNVLAENTNAMTLAFLPQFEIPDRKKANLTLPFLQELGVKPQGVPVLILDIVNDVNSLKGHPLTIYDRVIKVSDYNNVAIDIDLVLSELEMISRKHGYSSTCGIVTVRNLGRKGTGYDYELRNAISVLNSFLGWRVNNKSQPFRLQIDEAAQAGTSQAYSVENISMKQRLEEAIQTTRRGNFAMDIATQLTGEISPTVRNETANNFWKNLRETGERRRSPLDVLLDSLSLEEGLINSIKMLNKDPQFRNSFLMFWHEMSTMELNLIQPIPPPFMVQVSDMSIAEVYKAYLKSHPDGEDFRLKGNPEIWLDLSEKGKGEETEEEIYV